MATAEEIVLIVKAKVDKAIRDMKKFNGQLGKTDKSSKGMSKNLKETAATFAAFAAGATVAFVALKKTVDAASALEEATGKFNEVFDDTAISMQIGTEAVEELTNAYMVSEREAKQYLGSMQDLLVPLGILPDKAAAMSTTLVKLSADLGSFNDQPTATVMADIQSAMVGNFETMKKYGVVLNETRIKQEAMNMGLHDGKGVVDAVTKANVAYKLILQDTAAAHGDVARTADSWANRMKQLEATSEDFAAAIGQELIPSLKEIMDSFSMTRTEALNLATGIGLLLKETGKLWLDFTKIAAAAGPLGAVLKFQAASIGWLKDQVAAAGAEHKGFFKEITKGMPGQKGFFDTLADGVPKVKQTTQAVKEMNKSVKRTGSNYAASRQKAQEAISAFLAKGEENANAEILKENQKFAKLKAEAQKFHLDVEGLERQHQENLQTIKEELELQESERRLESFNNIVQATQDITGQISGIFAQYFKNQNIQLNNDHKKRRKAIIDNVKDEGERKKQLEALDAEFAKKRAEQARKQAKAEKALALIGAIQATALGVTKALAGSFNPAFNIAMASVIGALGAAQVALIAKQPIPEAAEGGIIPGSASGTILRAGENNRQEAIIPLENEDALDRAGIGGPSINVTVNIENAFTDEEFPEKVAVEIDKAMSKLVQDRNSRLQDSLG
jgi:hypothetical protein